jgi:TRAP-type mannitol/chloroaromatic compound transport system permease small subunit
MGKLSASLHIIDKISEWTGKIISFAMVLVIGIFIWSIVHRYVFHLATTWNIMTVGKVFFVYIILGAAYTLYTRAHVNVSILYGRFSLRVRSIVDLVTFTFFLSFCILLIWMAVETMFLESHYFRLSLKSLLPPHWPATLVAPVGIFLLLLQGLAKFIRDLIIAVTGKEPA